MILGLILKIFPFVSGITVAINYPEETKTVISTVTPIAHKVAEVAIEALQGVPLS